MCTDRGVIDAVQQGVEVSFVRPADASQVPGDCLADADQMHRVTQVTMREQTSSDPVHLVDAVNYAVTEEAAVGARLRHDRHRLETVRYDQVRLLLVTQSGEPFDRGATITRERCAVQIHPVKSLRGNRRFQSSIALAFQDDCFTTIAVRVERFEVAVGNIAYGIRGIAQIEDEPALHQ